MADRIAQADEGRLRPGGLTSWRPAFEAARVLLWPASCVACGAPTGEGQVPWCQGCAVRLAQTVGGRACPRCGRSAGAWEVSARGCPECRKRSLGYRQMVRVGSYTGVLRELILSHKYHGRWQLADVLGGMLGQVLRRAAWFDRVEVLTAVPLHWSRRLIRGYDHTHELAHQVAARVDRPAVAALRAVRLCRPQVGLSETQRRQNVRGAFAPVRGVHLSGRVCCVIDDVRTTGATLAEAGRALRRAGARAVFAAVIARTEAYHPVDQPDAGGLDAPEGCH